jgi:peroxiredoxin
MQLDPEILEAIFTNDGCDLGSLSQASPILLVFLRHFGCTFCREALSDISKIRSQLEAQDVKIVIVHMAEPDLAAQYLQQYKLADIAHISDPDMSIYEYFGLFKGTFFQLYGLKVWARGLKAGLIDGHGGVSVDKKLGNYNQMPGVFVLKNCRVGERFLHNSAADRPNYLQIVANYFKKNPNH